MTNDERKRYFRDLQRRVDRSKYYKRVLSEDNTRLNNHRKMIAASLGVPVSNVIVTSRGSDFMFTVREGR